MLSLLPNHQRWSQGRKARGQGQGQSKNARPRPRTALPRTDTLEVKDRNARGQGPKTLTQVLSKKRFPKFFSGNPPQKKRFRKNFADDLQNFNHLKISAVLEARTGQFSRTWNEALRPKPRPSKCVLEAKDVFEDSTSAKHDLQFLIYWLFLFLKQSVNVAICQGS